MPSQATSRSKPSATTSPTAPTPSQYPQTFTDNQPLPKAIIFDLDYTLWPFWIDTHVTPPFKPSTSGTYATDRSSMRLEFYKDVPSILLACREKGILVAAASRTHTPDLARQLLGMLKVGQGKARDAFDDLQIFPGDKVRHMTNIRDKLGVEYSDMLFFDDEGRNRNVERELGVCFQLVRTGVGVAEIDDGVRRWRGVGGRARGGGGAGGGEL